MGQEAVIPNERIVVAVEVTAGEPKVSQGCRNPLGSHVGKRLAPARKDDDVPEVTKAGVVHSLNNADVACPVSIRPSRAMQLTWMEGRRPHNCTGSAHYHRSLVGLDRVLVLAKHLALLQNTKLVRNACLSASIATSAAYR